jgi:hypothetical protein
MELDTNILQTKTVRTIVKVLEEIGEDEHSRIHPMHELQVTEIIKRHGVAMSLMKSYQE